MNKPKTSWNVWCNRLIGIYAAAIGAVLLSLGTCTVLRALGLMGNRVLTGVILSVATLFVLLCAALAVYTKFFVESPREPMPLREPVVKAPMPEGFVAFKRRIYTAVLVRVLAVALSAGLVTLAVCVALRRFGETAVSVGACIGLPLLAAAITAGVALLLLRPSERRVAGTLDTRFAMNERVQTMLAFRNSNEPMAILQRADTDGRLREIPQTALKHHSVWACLCALVLCVALLGGAIFVPVTAEESTDGGEASEVPVDPPFQLSEWQITAMENLIADVRASDMESVPKNALVAELENLLTALRTTTTVAQMKTKVIAVIVRADEIARDSNTYDDISRAMEVSLNDGVVSLGEAIGVTDNPAYRTVLDTIAAALTDADKITAFATDLRQALSGAGVNVNDALYCSLTALAEALDKLGSARAANLAQGVQNAFDAFYLSSTESLEGQYANSGMALTVRIRLMDIFGISASEIPKTGVSGGAENQPPQKPENEGQHGAPGTGDTLYGSKDTIYYPDDNTHIEYGDKISEFYAKVQEQLQGHDYSEEMKEAIIKYFEALYGMKYPSEG